MCSDVILQLKNLSKQYYLYPRPVDRLLHAARFRFGRNGTTTYPTHTALQPLSLQLRKGECVGILGRNGSGKSTLLQLICGTLTPTTGNITTHGKIAALLELGAGFNLEFSGRENIHLNAAILGLSPAEIAETYNDIITFSGLGERLEQPVKTYSSGMVVRLAFAVAVHVKADILIIDEALAVGDERFQKKCFDRLRELQANGVTILFVSHAANTITELCDRALLLEQGELLLDTTPKNAVHYYRKLLYATDAQLPAILHEIRNTESATIAAPAAMETATTAHYIPNMIPESRLEYPSTGITLEGATLTTETGEPVNMLVMGETYTLRLRARAEQPFHQMRFNYRITSLTGVEVSGANSAPIDNELQNISTNHHCEIHFRFHCNLMPGSYFITLNALGNATPDVPLSLRKRINDALMFQVQPISDVRFFGFAVLDAGVACHTLQP